MEGRSQKLKMEIQLSDEQNEVLDTIIEQMEICGFDNPYYLRDLFLIRIGGYAGTGKTTLLAYLRKKISALYPKLCIAFVTYTGKASSVLKSKLDSHAVNTAKDYVGTIHGLIYKAETKWDRRLKSYVVVGWKLKDPDDMYYDLIIIDEGSMVSAQIWADLKQMNRPIIVLGDHGQLPPIGDSFSLLANPDFKLKTIHRQALKSPIIALSKFVRENGYIPFNRIFSKDVFKLSWNHPKCKHVWKNRVVFDENLIILCAFNTTRQELNKEVRKKLDYTERIPCPGERIVCLQNNHRRGIMNGQIASLIWLMPENYNLFRMTLSVDGYPEPIESTVSDKCFGEVTYTMYDRSEKSKKQFLYASQQGISPVDFFDYGYVMSVHKSQGSEWDKVILFEQRTKRWNDDYYARWLYTAITRARKKLFVISDYWG
jgi:exodeoxyribonuclease-5